MQSTSTTYRFTALTLAFLMLFSSVGFSIDMHFCQGHLKSVSLFGKAKSCHDTAKMAACPHHQKKAEKEQSEVCSMDMDRKDCCQNETLHFQLDQEQRVQTSNFIASQHLQQFVIAYIAVYFHKDFTPKETPAFTLYKIPLIPRDIPVLFEAFLI